MGGRGRGGNSNRGFRGGRGGRGRGGGRGGFNGPPQSGGFPQQDYQQYQQQPDPQYQYQMQQQQQQQQHFQQQGYQQQPQYHQQMQQQHYNQPQQFQQQQPILSQPFNGGGGYQQQQHYQNYQQPTQVHDPYGGMSKNNMRKQRRRQEQLAATDAKGRQEADFFWQCRRTHFQNVQSGRGGRGGRRQDERSIFGSMVKSGINFDQYESIDVTRKGEAGPPMPCIDSFQTLKSHVPKFLTDNLCRRMKYDKPTPVQKHAIPLALAGHDLMTCAQTGSGKTCAFLIPVVAALSTEAADSARLTMSGPHDPVTPLALVLAPTRELASQIHNEAIKICFTSNLNPVVVYGGAPARPQLAEMSSGVDILVATPGRLTDFLDRGLISLSHTRFLILDEADRMLDMGFEPQIRRIVEGSDLPPKQSRQTLMFSATFAAEIQKLASNFLRPYVWIAVGRVGSTVDSITQKLVLAPKQPGGKLDLLMQSLKETEGRTLVFTQKKRTASWVKIQLCRSGIRSEDIHGDRPQPQREAALNAFREGKCRVLVATDVAARGLDIPSVTHVIQYDLPDDFDSYVHRIGRTGRAGHSGLATSFYVPADNDWLNGVKSKILKHNGPVWKQLHDLLKEANQEVPEWFTQLPEARMYGGGGGSSGSNMQRDIRPGQAQKFQMKQQDSQAHHQQQQFHPRQNFKPKPHQQSRETNIRANPSHGSSQQRPTTAAGGQRRGGGRGGRGGRGGGRPQSAAQ